MSTTFYSPEYTVYPGMSDYSSLKLRFGCTYDVTNSNGSVTISGTVTFQHKGAGGPSSSTSTQYCGRCGIDTTAPILDDTYSDTSFFNGKVYIAEPPSIASTGTTTLSAISQHSSWTTIKSKSFSFTVSKKTSSQSIYLSVGYGVLTTTRIRGATYKTISVPALPSYAITYNANGGSGAPASQTKYYGTNITLSSTKPTRTNYVFKNWNTKSDGTGTTYNPGASYTANAALTLYAQWYAPYTVTYNANGGTGGPTTQTKVYNTNLTLTTSQPTRSGYAFVKWNTKSDGTGTSYNSGATYSSNANVTLYAIWAAVPSIGTLTAVRCDENGDQDDEGAYATVTCTWSCSGSSTITGTITPQSGGSATSFTFGTNSSGSGTVTSIALVGSGNGMELDTDMQYTVSVTVTCITSGTTKTATRNVILTRAFFVMDWKAGGGGVGIGRAAPESGLEVGYETTFDDDVNIFGEPKIKATHPVLKLISNTTDYVSYIKAYDTDPDHNGHNMVIQSGGNMFVGGGESPSELATILNDTNNLDSISRSGENVFISADGTVRLYSNCSTVENRRSAVLGTDGCFYINPSSSLVDPNIYINMGNESLTTNQYNNVTASTIASGFMVRDKSSNHYSIAQFRGEFIGSGNSTEAIRGAVNAFVAAQNMKTDGTMVANYFRVWVRKDGSHHYSVSTPANFRSDLDLAQGSTLGTRTAKEQSTNVSVANNSWANITSISLSAGTWVVEGSVSFASNGTGKRFAGLSTLSGSYGQSVQRMTGSSTNAISSDTTVCKVGGTFTFSATTTLYIGGWQNSGSALSATAGISAVRFK